jgi:hypothetical protein
MATLTPRALLAPAVVLALALLLWLAAGHTPGEVGRGGEGAAVAPAAAGAPAPAGVGRPDVGFRHSRDLADHFARHGAETGAASAADYLARAQALRDRPSGGDVLEAVRADGVITRFDRRQGEFLAFNPDLTIRTFFRPNDGERYFQRQLARGRAEP